MRSGSGTCSVSSSVRSSVSSVINSVISSFKSSDKGGVKSIDKSSVSSSIVCVESSARITNSLRSGTRNINYISNGDSGGSSGSSGGSGSVASANVSVCATTTDKMINLNSDSVNNSSDGSSSSSCSGNSGGDGGSSSSDGGSSVSDEKDMYSIKKNSKFNLGRENSDEERTLCKTDKEGNTEDLDRESVGTTDRERNKVITDTAQNKNTGDKANNNSSGEKAKTRTCNISNGAKASNNNTTYIARNYNNNDLGENKTDTGNNSSQGKDNNTTNKVNNATDREIFIGSKSKKKNSKVSSPCLTLPLASNGEEAMNNYKTDKDSIGKKAKKNIKSKEVEIETSEAISLRTTATGTLSLASCTPLPSCLPVLPSYCDFCPFSTHHKESMKKHRSRHTGEGKIFCRLCPYTTIHAYLFKVHILTTHDRSRLQRCRYCEYTAARNETFRRHLKSHIQKGEAQPIELDEYNERAKLNARKNHQNLLEYRDMSKERNNKPCPPVVAMEGSNKPLSVCGDLGDKPIFGSPKIEIPEIGSSIIGTPAAVTPVVASPTVASPTIAIPTIAIPTIASPTIASPTIDTPTMDTPTVVTIAMTKKKKSSTFKRKLNSNILSVKVKRSRLKNENSVVNSNKENGCGGVAFKENDRGGDCARLTTAKSPLWFACDHCTFLTRVKTDLVFHNRRHDLGYRLGCLYCSFTSYDKEEMNSHSATHSGFAREVCPLCDFTSSTSSSSSPSNSSTTTTTSSTSFSFSILSSSAVSLHLSTFHCSSSFSIPNSSTIIDNNTSTSDNNTTSTSINNNTSTSHNNNNNTSPNTSELFTLFLARDKLENNLNKSIYQQTCTDH